MTPSYIGKVKITITLHFALDITSEGNPIYFNSGISTKSAGKKDENRKSALVWKIVHPSMPVSLTPIRLQFHRDTGMLLQPQHVLSIDHIDIIRGRRIIPIFDVNGELVVL